MEELWSHPNRHQERGLAVGLRQKPATGPVSVENGVPDGDYFTHHNDAMLGASIPNAAKTSGNPYV
jgi:hypothetical protein